MSKSGNKITELSNLELVLRSDINIQKINAEQDQRAQKLATAEQRMAEIEQQQAAAQNNNTSLDRRRSKDLKGVK